MDDIPYIFVIPGFFVAICVVFILLNSCYYKRKLGQSQNVQKITHQVSIIDISNIANSSPASPSSIRKERKGSRGIYKTGTFGAAMRIKDNNSTSISKLNLLKNEFNSDLPPSYGSLFERSPIPNRRQRSNSNVSQQSSTNNWLHPNSAYCYPSSKSGKTGNESAVLYL